ncbi:thermonuclease family protein [Falsirhodobacter sp. alg1]|uniref:thermonuclease family protein n=1 Tax=Falsirhodobacter sp. alg1 TaxID=1472418 RepID=UPI0007884C85|nr:thermonuclease family protein [Falsirhodobacter sp. alg1]
MAVQVWSTQTLFRELGVGGTKVIDGDTLNLKGERIRLFGIDAPESAQTCRSRFRVWRCGQKATQALTRLIGSRAVSCEKRNTDRYGRSVATCKVGTVDINAWMVRNGWAVAYRAYGGTIYAANEAAAKIARAGIWGSKFTMPWDWRKSH